MRTRIVAASVLALACALSSVPVSAHALETFGSQSKKIIVFQDGVSQNDAAKILDQVPGTVADRKELDSGKATAGIVTDETARQLAKAPGVARVEDDIELVTQGRLDRKQKVSWGFDAVQARAAWPVSREGQAIRVGIIDTGIDMDHPDLLAVLKGGVNEIDSQKSWDDDGGHGTHVAGIVAAQNNHIGTLGVAPNVKLYGIKALNRRGIGYLSDIIQGIDWAIAHHLDVLNMSLGTSADIPSLHEAINRALAAHVTVVAAAGNSGGSVLYPAAYDGVIAVGMVDHRLRVNRHSSGGTGLDVVAPGVRILSTYKRGRYRVYTGTSMATPYVTGAVALLLATPNSCNHGCAPSTVERLVRNSATDLLSPGWDVRSGSGLVNINALVSQ